MPPSLPVPAVPPVPAVVPPVPAVVPPVPAVVPPLPAVAVPPLPPELLPPELLPPELLPPELVPAVLEPALPAIELLPAVPPVAGSSSLHATTHDIAAAEENVKARSTFVEHNFILALIQFLIRLRHPLDG
jgi:hypothetical protein